jgi:queuine/archaeosine tRNA-ribosyltransferase
MSDVYIIYASEDRAVAEKLVELLKPLWDVWWDDMIVGDFAKAIEREMKRAKCVIPLWSPSSREKTGSIGDELRLAETNNLHIIPAKVEACAPPYTYGNLSFSDLCRWKGEADHPGFRQLLRRIASIVPPRGKPAQPSAIGSHRVKLPALFLSVSSHETQLPPLQAVKALRLFRAPTILISAYDLIPERRPEGMLRELRQYRAQGGVVLIDSGNYEATRLKDKAWSPQQLERALAKAPHDWAFSFDIMEPSRSPSRAVDQIVAGAERDQKYTKAPLLPIVHAPPVGGGYALDVLPEVIRGVADRLQPILIGVPERELGRGLIARAQTVRRIRRELDKLPFYQSLHLLGTGNPWSIAVLAAAGADSFDGLEWCRIAVDRPTGRLHHYQHFDFFAYQARVADSPVTQAGVDDDRVDFAGKVALHNLDYYTEFARLIGQAAARKGLEAFVAGLLGQANAMQLTKQMPELFG